MLDMSALEHSALSVWLLVSFILILVSVFEPHWAISGEYEGGEDDTWVSIGLWKQCVHIGDGSRRECTLINTNLSPPDYFIYTRWSLCITTGLIGLSILTSLAANPKLFQFRISPSGKFLFRLSTALSMIIGGILSIIGESWFTWSCYANKLEKMTGFGNFNGKYTPDWCIVICFVQSCILIIGGSVHLIRACFIQTDEDQSLTHSDIYYRNKSSQDLKDGYVTKTYKPYSELNNKRNKENEKKGPYTIKPVIPTSLVPTNLSSTMACPPVGNKFEETSEERVRNWAYENRVYI